MVDDKAIKDLPAHSGTLPPDAIFSFVHNDVAKRVSFQDLQVQYNNGAPSTDLEFPGFSTIPPAQYLESYDGSDTDLTEYTGRRGIAVVSVNPQILNVGTNRIVLEALNQLSEYVAVGDPILLVAENSQLVTIPFLIEEQFYRVRLDAEDGEGACDVYLCASIGVFI